MKEILTTNNKTILVDDDVYEIAIKYKWYARSNGKYYRVYTFVNGKTISFKKLIWDLGLPKKTLFINGNSLDLRRVNIAVYDNMSELGAVIGRMDKNINKKALSKTMQGGHPSNKKNSSYIGVTYHEKNSKKWMAIIKCNQKNYYLGSFLRKEDAALAYDQKAYELYGPDAKVNFPQLSLEEVKEKVSKLKEGSAKFTSDIHSRGRQGKQQTVSKTSKYVGVSFDKRKKKWRVAINHKNKQYQIGYFSSEEEAALAYDKKAIELYGETARLNLPNLIEKNS